jgi:hypothetical protein
VRKFEVFNSTDQDVYVSFGGTTNKLRVASGSGQTHDVTTNTVGDNPYFLPVGAQFKVKHLGVAPSSGTVWIQAMCASGGV